MSTRTDTSAVTSQSTASGQPLMRLSVDTVEERAAAGIPANPSPAIEEGPHLADPAVRRLKRQQLRDAGLNGDEDHLTNDLKAILAEEVE